MAITLNQVATHAKALLREPNSDSITVTQMEDYVRAAYLDWCQELRWPEGDLTQDTVADQQEYSLPDTLNVIFRVYVNGQRAMPTTIALLEGDVAGRFDPSWRTAQSQAIPQLTGAGLSIPITQGNAYSGLWYYLRGGKIGIYPKPSGVYTGNNGIRIEGAVFPLSPNSSDDLVLPDQFKDGLAYGGCKRFLLSDSKVTRAQAFELLEVGNDVQGKMGGEFAKAMRWRRRLESGGTDNLAVIAPINYRGWYSRGNSRI